MCFSVNAFTQKSVCDNQKGLHHGKKNQQQGRLCLRASHLLCGERRIGSVEALIPGGFLLMAIVNSLGYIPAQVSGVIKGAANS